MADIEISSLDIRGFQGKDVPNKYFHRSEASTTLAVIFPGLNYTCDMPLLYYLHRLLMDRAVDVLELHTDYTGSTFHSLPGEEKYLWIAADAQAAVEKAIESFAYTKFLFVGKSIGTLALTHLISLQIEKPSFMIWLTPLLHNQLLVEQTCQLISPSLFIGSRGDHSFDETVMNYIQRKIGCDTYIIDDANHRLELPGDFKKSLTVLGNVLYQVELFLGKHAIRGD